MSRRFHSDSTRHPTDPPAGRRREPVMGRLSFVALSALLAIVLGVAGAAPAWTSPTGPNIRLDVHDHASNGSDGYTDTTASNGAIYSYRYSGGEGKGGDVIFRSRGRVTFQVRLDDGSDYTIEQVRFMEDTHQQLSWLTERSSSTHAVVQDVNDTVQTARYKVTVRDNRTGVTVPCDPIVANRG